MARDNIDGADIAEVRKALALLETRIDTADTQAKKEAARADLKRLRDIAVQITRARR